MAKNKKKKGKVKTYDPALDTGERRPVTAVVAVGDINDKYSSYPSNALNPRRLARIFLEADQGDVMSQMELFEEALFTKEARKSYRFIGQVFETYWLQAGCDRA